MLRYSTVLLQLGRNEDARMIAHSYYKNYVTHTQVDVVYILVERLLWL